MWGVWEGAEGSSEPGHPDAEGSEAGLETPVCVTVTNSFGFISANIYWQCETLSLQLTISRPWSFLLLSGGDIQVEGAAHARRLRVDASIMCILVFH